MAGRKPLGYMSPTLVGGWGPTEFEGKDRKRSAERAHVQRADSAIVFAVAYRLQQYADARILKAMIDAVARNPKFPYSKDWLEKVRKRFKGDILAQIPDKTISRGPIDKRFEGDEWLHHNGVHWSDGRKLTLYEVLEGYGMPAP